MSCFHWRKRSKCRWHIEPMHPRCAADCTFLTDLNSVVALIDEFQSNYLKLAYDTYHFPLGAAQRSTLAKLAPYIGIVHLADRRVPPSIDQERCPLGQGRVPLAEIVTTLLESGYTGAFDVKLLGPEIGLNDYWMLLEQSQAGLCRAGACSGPEFPGVTASSLVRINAQISIPRKELRFSFVRSSGPGRTERQQSRIQGGIALARCEKHVRFPNLFVSAS